MTPFCFKASCLVIVSAMSQIAEIPAQLLKPVLIFLVVTIVEKLMIAFVHDAKFPSMFDGTPVLFRSARYFLDIGNQAVEVAAINTIQLFYWIEIAQALAVQHNKIISLHYWYAIDFKTDELIK